MTTMIVSVVASAAISYIIAAEIKKQTLKLVEAMCKADNDEITEIKNVAIRSIESAVDMIVKNKQ